jgi:hypothetical protein
MVAPPLDSGAENVTTAWPSPATAETEVGAPGTTGFTEKLWATVEAADHATLPTCAASIVQVPAVTKTSAPPVVIVHTSVVDDEKVTVKPDVAVAVRVGVVPKSFAPGLLKVMVWVPFGVTLLEAAEARLVPTLLAAVTVKVYVVPLVRPVTVIGLPVPVAVMEPGLDATVYSAMVAPPLDDGAEKLMVAWTLPAVADTEVGAPGATGLTAKLRLTVLAARYVLFPDWSASIEQVPTARRVRVLPATVHTPVVVEVNVTVSPDVEVAERPGDVPNDWAPGLLKSMV